jgi:hypothetical protein
VEGEKGDLDLQWRSIGGDGRVKERERRDAVLRERLLPVVVLFVTIQIALCTNIIIFYILNSQIYAPPCRDSLTVSSLLEQHYGWV